MISKKIKNANEGVVGIVVTVLLIGLIVAVMVMVNNVYVPNWVEQQESSHMGDVAYEFKQLKFALDIQTIVNDTTAISTPITLGSREIPVFDTGRTFGSLMIVPSDCIFTINYTVNSTALQHFIITDTIKYSSGNSYYVDQNYMYQAGALILSQDDADVLIGKPSIFVKKPVDRKNITMNFVDIAGIEGKTTAGGYGTYGIYTQVSDPDLSYTHLTNVSEITIETAYPNAWNTTIQRSFLQQGLNINYTAVASTNKLTISIYPDELGGYYYDMYVRTVEVNSEIGFGLSNN